MALQKQPININFGKGLDLKTDPNQVALGNMLSLENAVFNKGGLLTKRNGFGLLPSLPDLTSKYITTQNTNLVTLGNSLQTLSNDTRQWLIKGNFQDVETSTISTVRTTSSQLNVDTVIAANGAACTVYLDADGFQYYTVTDSITGERIVAPTALPATSAMARVSVILGHFIVTHFQTISAATHLRYFGIPIYSPQNPTSPTSAATDVKSLTAGYDTIVANNNLYFAYWSNSGGDSIQVGYINRALLTSFFVNIAGHTANLVSLSADNSTGTPTIYVSFYQTSNTTTYCSIFSANLVPISGPTVVLATTTINHLTSYANAQVNELFYQVTNVYSYNSVRSDYLEYNTINSVATVSSPVVLKRSVGLGSKAFMIGTTTYLLINYGGAYQPTYYLMDASGNLIGELAYSNGVQYAYNQILPQGNVADTTVSIGYLFKDLLAPVNKSLTANSVNGIYTQTGINLAAFDLNSGMISSNEIAGSLHITGGFLWMYDGTIPVEHGFFVWPEDIAATSTNTGGALKPQDYFYQVTYEWTDARGNIHRSSPSVPLEVNLTSATASPVTFTSSFASGASTITVSSVTGLFVGQAITDTTNPANIQANTTITAINGSVLTLSLPTAGAAAPNTLQTVETFTNTLKIPTLRLTYKAAPNNVRIVIYRWSTSNQVFYQITSIPNPIQNDTTTDFITYVDTQSDEVIIGNLILYTTGGVLENIVAPACGASTLFKNRMFIVDSENPNLIWFSKQVVQNTPLEFNDTQTIFIAPSIAVGNTGPITALSALDDKLVIFKENALYYLTGTGPDITGAQNDFSDPVFITSTIGCNNQNSIVFTPLGIMFQSDKGLWLLDRGLGTKYVGAAVEDYTLGYEVLSALAIPGTNQVRFTMNNNVTLMYDYFFDQWGTFVGIPSLSSTLYQGLHTYINSYGQALQETPGSYLDASRPVTMQFTTNWVKLSDLQGYQRAYYFYLLGKFITPHTLSISIAYDYNSSPSQVTLLTPDNFSGFYGDDPLYGDQSPYGGEGNVEQWRVFLEKQRCESFQISIQENYDPSLDVAAGAGLTLSGLNMVVGVKKGYAVLKASRSVG